MRFEEELRKAKEKEQSEGQQRSEGTESERQRRRRCRGRTTSRERKALRKLQELRKTMEATGGFELGRDAASSYPMPVRRGRCSSVRWRSWVF